MQAGTEPEHEARRCLLKAIGTAEGPGINQSTQDGRSLLQ
jgi:hypothetical protein